MPLKKGLLKKIAASTAIILALIIICISIFSHLTLWWGTAEFFLCIGLFIIIFDWHDRSSLLMKQSNAKTIELEQTHNSLVRANEHIVALHGFSQQITGCETIQSVCHTVTTALVNSFSYDASIFWLWDNTHNKLMAISAAGNIPALIDLPDTLTQHDGLLESVMRSKQTVLIRRREEKSNDKNNEKIKLLESVGLYSVVVTPLMHENEILGVLLAGFQEIQSMDTHDAKVIESLLNTASDRMAKGQLELLDEKEESVFNSVSNLAGNALARVIMFSSMEAQIEKRAKELTLTHEKLAQTREIIIQVEKLSSLGKMAAGVIHEINDPLNFLVNILPDLKRDFEGLTHIKTLLLTPDCPADLKQKVQNIVDEYELESHLEELDFIFSRASDALGKSSRIASGLQVFSQGGKSVSKSSDLIALVTQTLELIPRKTKGDIAIHLDPASEILWEVNPDRFSQVCMNLIINALDAMNGQGTLTIAGTSSGTQAHISFSDDGPGIPLAIQKKIFDPFFTTKPAGKSTGLGLTICAEIVRDYGGRFEIDSAPGTGTRFTIYFSEEQRTAFNLALPV